MSAKFTRTIHEIKAEIMAADTVNESFNKVQVTVDDSGINWKGYKEGRISDADVRYYIMRSVTKSGNDDFTEDFTPVKVISWERISGKYECSLDDFLSIAKRVDD